MIRPLSILPVGLLALFLAGPGAANAAQNNAAGATPASESIRPGQALSIEECVEIALKNQPNIIAAKGTVEANKSRTNQEEAAYYPTVNLSAGYSRVLPVPSAARPTITSTQSFDLYSTSLSVNQNIYNFGKTSSKVKVQELNTESARSDLKDTVDRTVLNVYQAYYGFIQAKKNRDVALEAVRQFEQHLEQARGFFDVGLKPRFDVIKAETDLSNSRVNLIKAENAVRLAMVTLKDAMGAPDVPDFEVIEDLTVSKDPITMDEAVTGALQNRADLRSAAAKKRSAQEAVTAAKRNYYPTLDGSAAYTVAGDSIPFQDGWSADVTLSVPIFTGFLSKYQVREARANLDVAAANEELSRQAVILDVKQAFLNLREAEERIPASEIASRQASENLEIANGRYATGVGSPVEVTDALVAYINARTAYLQAITDYKIAQASLERAMGGRQNR